MDSDLHWKSNILQSKYGMLGEGHRDGMVSVLSMNDSIDEYSVCPEQTYFNKMQVVNKNLKQLKTIFPGLGKLQYQTISKLGHTEKNTNNRVVDAKSITK